MNDGVSGSDAILGNWHLVDVDANDVDPPQHRVDFAIRRTESGLGGAILSRRDGTDVGLLAVQRDGPTVRLHMRFPNQDDTVEPPWLVLGRTRAGFEGHWHDAANEPMGPMLKVIRARH
jgi:hypothetical protein